MSLLNTADSTRHESSAPLEAAASAQSRQPARHRVVNPLSRICAATTMKRTADQGRQVDRPPLRQAHRIEADQRDRAEQRDAVR